MKILYGIQGTGNGHVTVALEVLPYLMKKGQVDILVSGSEIDVKLPYEVKYRLDGLGFVFGKKGGIDYMETYKKARLKKLFREIESLPVEEYDLVFSDFEPISAWACYLKNKPCIGFSHQVAIIAKLSPKPKKSDLLGSAVLRYYAPASAKYGFHFVPYNDNIFTPIIRQSIRRSKVTVRNHYTVYLPAYSDNRIIKLLSCFPEEKWEVFSKRCPHHYKQENIHFYPVTDSAFVESMVSSKGVFCGAGFQTPSEALYLQKKLLVIPMKGQYEQQCNAAALRAMGIPVLKNMKRKQANKLKEWIGSDNRVMMGFPDETEWILNEIIQYEINKKPEPKRLAVSISSAGKFRNYIMKKIVAQLSV